MISHIITIIFSIFYFFIPLQSTEIIQGNPGASANTTFSFAIKENVLSAFGNLYIGAHENLTNNKEYALSRLSRNKTSFEPIAPELVVLNQEVDQPNPLFGAKINALSLLKPLNGTDTPIVVTNTDPTVVYLVEKSANPTQMSIVQTPPVNDAHGLPTSGIISVETNIISHVFAAVKPALGQFGDDGSGIALLARGGIDTGLVFAELDAATGMISNRSAAAPLDKNSPLVTLNTTALSEMGSVVSLHWDDALKKLFIGLDVTSGTNSTDGALGVVVGSLAENGGLTLSSIAPNDVFIAGNTNNIIGVRNQAGSIARRVHIASLTTLYTSTGLNYLIVVGGVVTDNNTLKSVYALPLVNTGNEAGMIASNNAQPTNRFSDGDIPKLISRLIATPTTTSDNFPQKTDPAALVGGGILSAGTITNIFSRDDTLFACVGNQNVDPSAAGIYSSQAIFNAAGTVIGWTEWQRAVGTTSNVFDGMLDVFNGSSIFMTGQNKDSINTVVRTTWSNGNPQGLLPVTQFLNSLFNPSNGGIQSLQTFLPSTPGLAEIALMIAGGIGNIVLIQTGMLENNIIIPTESNEWNIIKQYNNGTITEFVDAKIMSIEGGALNTLGPITNCTIASNKVNGWLFAGGSGGLAILSYPDGSGWDIELNELGNTFDGIRPGMSFKTVGNYTFVKKLICDSSFLYVITADRIDRINLTTSNFATNTLDVTTIATENSLSTLSINNPFLDAVVSQSFALIATTMGLLRIADNKDVRLIENADALHWTFVPIPETAGAPAQLIPVSTTGRPEDITRIVGGHIYVLSSNPAYNQSRINRFAVSPLSDNQTMQATTIQPFDDLFVEDIPSFFLNFNNFNSIFSTNGALYFASHNKHGELPPAVNITPGYPAPQVAARNVGERSSAIAINLNDATEINALQQNQASGSWMVAGDFGIQVLE